MTASLGSLEFFDFIPKYSDYQVAESRPGSFFLRTYFPWRYGREGITGGKAVSVFMDGSMLAGMVFGGTIYELQVQAFFKRKWLPLRQEKSHCSTAQPLSEWRLSLSSLTVHSRLVKGFCRSLSLASRYFMIKQVWMHGQNGIKLLSQLSSL